ncbi:MAG: hypothetical protein MZW92_10160 [Comamonadaceae bacterium]|nr:hypothetical protein [Comamonadaceae bacterium]
MTARSVKPVMVQLGVDRRRRSSRARRRRAFIPVAGRLRAAGPSTSGSSRARPAQTVELLVRSEKGGIGHGHGSP